MTADSSPADSGTDQSSDGSADGLKLVGLALLLGCAISIAVIVFIALMKAGEDFVWYDIPKWMGQGDNLPWWYLLLVPTLGGVVVAFARRLPGDGGHSPLDGFHGGITANQLASVVIAALFTLWCGVILGPEAPLVALGVGLTSFFMGKKERSQPGKTETWQVLAACAALAAIAGIFGSPIIALVLLLEATAIGGAIVVKHMAARLVAVAVAFLIFLFANDVFHLDLPSLQLTALPSDDGISGWSPASLGWGIVIGAVCGFVALGIRIGGLQVRKFEKRIPLVALIPACGFIVGLLAVIFVAVSGLDVRDFFLFDGESGTNDLVSQFPELSTLALLTIVAFKTVGYSISLGSGFRGGPVFPSLFIGSAIGLLGATFLPGLSPLVGFAAGMGAMCAGMLRVPAAAVILVALLLGTGGASSTGAMLLAVAIATIIVKKLDKNPPPPLNPSKGVKKKEVASANTS